MAIQLQLKSGNIVLIDGDIKLNIPKQAVSILKGKDGKFRLYRNADIDNERPLLEALSTEILDEGGSFFADDSAIEAFFNQSAQTSADDFFIDVAMGEVENTHVQNKWGYNLDIDTAAGEIIRSAGGSFDPNTDIITVAQTLTVSYNNTTDGNGTTGALSILITYLDANYELQDSIHVLGSTGSDTTSFTAFGVNRVVVLSNGGAGWNVNDIDITATTDGTNQAQVPSLRGVTQQLIFHTPINYNFLSTWSRFKALKISGGGGSPRVEVVGYSWSRVTNTRYEIFREGIDTSVENTIDVRPTQPFILGGREVLWFEASTDTNNTQVSGRYSGILKRVV